MSCQCQSCKNYSPVSVKAEKRPAINLEDRHAKRVFASQVAWVKIYSSKIQEQNTMLSRLNGSRSRVKVEARIMELRNKLNTQKQKVGMK